MVPVNRFRADLASRNRGRRVRWRSPAADRSKRGVDRGADDYTTAINPVHSPGARMAVPFQIQ